MNNKILVVAETRDGALKGISKEAMVFAAEAASILSAEVVSVVLGAGVGGLAQEFAACGGARCLSVEDAGLEPYTPEAYVAALSQIIAQEDPTHVVTGHSYQAMDFFPRLAAAHGGALVPDATAMDAEGAFTRKVINGKLDARTVPAEGSRVFASLQQGAFPLSEFSGGAAVESFQADLSGVTPRTVVEIAAAEVGEVDLAGAEKIVSGGRGVGDKDKFQLVFDLADAIGAAVGASRPPCDSEWTEHQRQIGSSGQVVAPKLYMALGISGAIQHLVGMRGSQCIVAINKDANAAIFQEATYGIVGDLHEVVPELIAAINEAKE
jgi:electron transfer flavoprotein alpha subunit